VFSADCCSSCGATDVIVLTIGDGNEEDNVALLTPL